MDQADVGVQGFQTEKDVLGPGLRQLPTAASFRAISGPMFRMVVKSGMTFLPPRSQLHVQERIGPALLVRLRPLIDVEAHVFVKAPGKEVLLINGELSDAVPLHAVLEELFPKARPNFPGQEKEHLQRRPTTR